MKRLSPIGLTMGKRASALIDAGTAWFVGAELRARANDKVVVILGLIWTKNDVANLEGYLEAHPTPETW